MRIAICNTPPGSATELAQTLVRENLAACVNIQGNIQSVYTWEGELCSEQESTLIIKVAADGVSALRERVLTLHPYDVPEFVVLDVDADASHQPYIDWVRTQSSSSLKA